MISEREMARAIKLEKIRRVKYKIYQLDPLAWIEDVLGEPRRDFKWDKWDFYKEHKWDGTPNPLFKMFDSVAKNKWVAVSACTGSSKTYALARLMLWFLDVYEGSLVLTSAPREGQLKQNLWSEVSKIMPKFLKVRPYSRMTSLDLKPEGNNMNPYVQTRISHHAIGLTTGVGSEEESATKIQGYHNAHMLIILEETPGMHAAVMTAFQNTCTGVHNIIVAVGNPDGEHDELHKFSEQPRVESIRISAYDYPNVIAGEELYAGAVTIPSIDRRRDLYGEDSPMFKSRVRGITPSEGDNNLIRRAWIYQCVEGHETFIAEDRIGLNAMGVDVSNSEEGDKAATATGRSNRLLQIREFQCPNASHLAYNIFLTPNELNSPAIKAKGVQNYDIPNMKDFGILPDLIGIDSVGVGISTVNTFLEHNMAPTSLSGGASQWLEAVPVDPNRKDKDGKPIYLYTFANLRAQMYYELREDLRNGKVILDFGDPKMLDQLVKELTAVRTKLNEGKISIEGKEMIKKRLGGKSPNVADSVVYWNWVRKGYRRRNIIAVAPRG
jgi:hypothetical protein